MINQLLTTEREEFVKKFGYLPTSDYLPIERWLKAHDTKLLTVLKEEVEGMSVEKYPENGKDLKNHDFYLGYDKALSDLLKLLTAE